MKRLIPAVIILLSVIVVCNISHNYVNNVCDKTTENIENYHNKEIDSDTLEKNWECQKEKLGIFVNHGLLDDISMSIGKLTLYDTRSDNRFYEAYRDIQTTLEMIKEEQKFGLHSFY